jgi:hypothetical protein
MDDLQRRCSLEENKTNCIIPPPRQDIGYESKHQHGGKGTKETNEPEETEKPLIRVAQDSDAPAEAGGHAGKEGAGRRLSGLKQAKCGESHTARKQETQDQASQASSKQS